MYIIIVFIFIYFLRYSLWHNFPLNIFSQDGCALLLGCRYRLLCPRYIYECKWGVIFTWMWFSSLTLWFYVLYLTGQLVLCGRCVWCVLLLKTHGRCAEDQTFAVDFIIDFMWYLRSSLFFCVNRIDICLSEYLAGWFLLDECLLSQLLFSS